MVIMLFLFVLTGIEDVLYQYTSDLPPPVTNTVRPVSFCGAGCSIVC